MRKNILALSLSALAAAFMLTGCFDGPSAPANEADNDQMAVAAATTPIKTFTVSILVPKKTNNFRADGMPTAMRRCQERLRKVTSINLISVRLVNSRSWSENWRCSGN